jgi:hypothetical protein
MKEHGAILVPTTQEVWFIGGHCRHPGAAEVVHWPKEPKGHLLVDSSRQASSDTSSECSESDTDIVTPESAEPSEIKYIDDMIQFLKRKKKRIRKHKCKLTSNQKIQKQETERVVNASTPFQRSTRCTLPSVVDEEEAEQYYKSWERVKQVAKIALIGAYAMRSLATKPENQVMAISMEDIMVQHEKDEAEEADPKERLPPKYHDLINVFSGKAANSTNTLPPHRKGVDHHIELEPGKRPDWVLRFYRSTQEEMEEIRR